MIHWNSILNFVLIFFSRRNEKKIAHAMKLSFQRFSVVSNLMRFSVNFNWQSILVLKNVRSSISVAINQQNGFTIHLCNFHNFGH